MFGFISNIFGKKNIETIESVAESIVETSLSCVINFVHNMANDDSKVTSTSDSYALASNEFLYFLLHYVNRLAFAVGGIGAQKNIYDNVTLYAVAKLVASMPKKIQSDVASMLLDGIAETERKYSKCKLSRTDGDESLKGTLFWEASKRISSSAGGGMDISILVAKFLTLALATLKLEGRIKALASAK